MDKVDKLITDRTVYIAELYRDIEANVIRDIAKMIKTHGYITATGKYELEALHKIVSLDRDVLEQLKRMTGKPMNEIVKALKDIGLSSVDYDLFRTAYERGLVFANIDTINVLSSIVGIQKSFKADMRRLQTSAIQNSMKEYRKALDIASISVNAGVMTPDKAIVQAVRGMAKQGITSATYLTKDGKEINQSIETVVTRHVRTQFISVSNETSHHVGEELGVNQWYVTQHLGARDTWVKDKWENHESWQGIVVNDEELFSKCGFREMLGLGGINCRHRHYAYIEGVSVKPVDKIDKEDNTHVTKLKTKQRSYERAIRDSKRIIMALEELGDNEEAIKQLRVDKKLLRKRQARLRELVKDNNEYLVREPNRERVLIND